MNEEINNAIGTPSITKEARTFDNLSMGDVVSGIRTANYLDGRVKEKEASKRMKKTEGQTEMPIPTGTEIREALQNEQYVR